MGTFIVLCIVVCCAGLAARSVFLEKKNGKSSCGGDCGRCKGCH